MPPIVYSLLAGAISAAIALKQKKNPFIWFGIGMLIGPIGCVILFFALPILGRFMLKRALKKAGQPTTAKNKANEPVTFDVTPSFDLEVEPSALKKLWYFLDAENKTVGPISFQFFYQRWKEGRILASTHVWNETLSEWKPFKEVFPNAKAPF